MAPVKPHNCKPVIYINENLTEICFFQNHNKVKTPEFHPPRCIQEHGKTTVLVSTQWEFTFLPQFVSQNWLWVQNRSRVTALLLMARKWSKTLFFNELGSPVSPFIPNMGGGGEVFFSTKWLKGHFMTATLICCKQKKSLILCLLKQSQSSSL